MAKKYLNWIFVSFILISVNTSVYGFDGNREGFILGIGIGPGYTSYRETITSEHLVFPNEFVSERNRQNKLGIATDFKIGYAPSNFLAIYYTNKVSWFGHKYSEIIADYHGLHFEKEYIEKWTVAYAITGIGVTYYFSPTAPSLFLSGALGYSSWFFPSVEVNSEEFFEQENPFQNSRFGLGLAIGVGYEYSRHSNLEFGLCWGIPKYSKGGVEISSNALVFKCTVNAIAY